jgi:hypothetical protein
MDFQSLDLAASECDGPQSSHCCHLVPACMNSCKPQHPLPGGRVEALRLAASGLGVDIAVF